MKNIYLAVFLLLVVIGSRASDTLIFKTRFEENQVKLALSMSNSDYVALYSSITSDSIESNHYESKIKTFYSYLNPKLASIKAGKQKAKLIFKEVHTHFFKKYEEDVAFYKIFENGTYNCVTACMLYSLILKNYDIPFEIKEKPTHVYLVAFPGSDNILFETTNPRGLFAPDEKFKREYVAGLVKMKFTTQEYVNSTGVPLAFNEFYYNSQSISPVQLAGIQYYNSALSLYRSEKYDEAIKSAVKMDMLYPCPKHQYVKINMIASVIGRSEFTSLKDIMYLCEYANSVRDAKDRKFVSSVFGDILREKLYKSGNDSFVNNAYQLIKDRIEDEKVREEITYDYYCGMSSWYQMKGDMQSCLEFAALAYAMNQKDVRLHDIIIRAIALKTEKLKAKEKNIDELNQYATKFPFLANHKSFKQIQAYQLSLLCYSLFLDNNGRDGYKYLSQLEALLASESEKMTSIEELIGMVYAEAGAYHFRRKEFKTAKQIMLKGLEIAPDHGELKERIRIVDNETKD